MPEWRFALNSPDQRAGAAREIGGAWIKPLPPADVSYVLVQGEWYSHQVSGTLMAGDYDKMMSVRPDEVVFNGVAFQFNDHPLTALVGQRVRF